MIIATNYSYLFKLLMFNITALLGFAHFTHAQQFATESENTNSNISCIKISEQDEFTFSIEKKKVMVLVHGMTPTFRNRGVSNGEVGSSRYPQYCWGYDFIKKLVRLRKDQHLILDYKTTPSRIDYKVFPSDWDNHSKYLSRDLIHPYLSIDSLVFNNTYLLKHPNASADVMCTYRVGSQHLMFQTKDAIEQIYYSYQNYYGDLPLEEQPMIYLLAHGFGGIVCRTILSNPTERDRLGFKLTTDERKMADFIRNRTVWLTTLSTPHEGSPLPKAASENYSTFSTLVSLYATIGIGAYSENWEFFFKELLDGKKDCLSDIQYNDFYLNGWLKPQNAKRSNGELIPIYTLTGANPGHLFFLHNRTLQSPTENSTNDLLNFHANHNEMKGYSKMAIESHKLLLLEMVNASGLLNANYWTKTYEGMNIGDKFKIQKFNDLKSRILDKGIQVDMGQDGYFDSDGFVGFESGHGLRLGTSTNNYFSGLSGGSWYRIYGKDYGVHHPWDYDNHYSICYNVGTAAFIGNHLLDKGPFAVKDLWSGWTKDDLEPALDKKRIHVEFARLKNLSTGELDNNGYWVEVKIGHGPYQRSENIREKQVLDSSNFQSGKNYIWQFAQEIPHATVVPIIIKVFKYNTAVNDQLCSTSSFAFLEETVIYVDTKTNMVYGDNEAPVGVDILVVGHEKSKHRTGLILRVKVENI